MAQPLRTVTSEDISRQMDAAPPLSDLDVSLVDTILNYIEADNLDAAKTYAAAMSTDGLARGLRNIIRAAQIIAVALVQKRMLRPDDGGEV